MATKIPAAILKERPQLKQIIEAIEEFNKTGKSTVLCIKCNAFVTVEKFDDIGVLSTNCNCGYCKSRDSWEVEKK